MFTGLIEALGKVTSVAHAGGGIKLRVDLGELAAKITNGASVAIDGACLTVTEIKGSEVAFDVGEETARVTTLSKFRAGRRVNLELPLTPQSQMGGHFVQGHVDGIAKIKTINARAGGRQFEFLAPPSLLQLMAPKGSVAIDGISLTIVDVFTEQFSVFVIPHTYSTTTLSMRKPGDAVNIETDMIGKYVFRYLTAPEGQSASSSELTEEKLKEQGFA